MKYCALLFNSSDCSWPLVRDTHARAAGHKTNVGGREICHRQDDMHWAFGNMREQRTETKNTRHYGQYTHMPHEHVVAARLAKAPVSKRVCLTDLSG